MLETCRSISGCESKLQEYLPSVKLVGQLPLNESDIERIFDYIHFAEDAHENLDTVIENTPAILACYLVWKGIQDYNEGTYWKSLSSELGHLDTNLQAKLGKFFQDFVKQHDLIHVTIRDSHKNITPILLHGIIPREQIAQFFEHVVYPLVRKELVNPRSKYELAYWLEVRREAAKRSEEFEALQRELRRAEEAQRPQAERDLSLLENRIRVIDERLDREEAALADLQAEFSSLDAVPSPLAEIESDLATVRRLEEEYASGVRELAARKCALEETQRELQQYAPLGIGDPRDVGDFDAFRRAVYTAILDAVAAGLGNSEDSSTEAYVLLAALHDSVSDGTLPLSKDLLERLEALYSIDGSLDDRRTPEASGESEACGVDADTDAECVIDPEGHGESLPYPGDGRASESDETMESDITAAHVQASDIAAGKPGPTLCWDPSAEDGTSLLLSRYTELHGMYLPGDVPPLPDCGADTTDREAGAARPVSEPGESSSSLLLASGETDSSEGLLPSAGPVLLLSDRGTRMEDPSDDGNGYPVPDGSEPEPPIEQEVRAVPPEVLEAQIPLDPRVPLDPREPEVPAWGTTDALRPTGRPQEMTPASRTVTSRSRTAPRTDGAISIFIDAIIDALSQFFRNLGK